MSAIVNGEAEGERRRRLEAALESARATSLASARRSGKASALLVRALPLLVKLGDYVGDDFGRCEVILAIRDHLKAGGIIA